MRAKKPRYEYLVAADNVIQAGKPLYDNIKGKWNSLYFCNSNPITLELACGRGEYTTALANLFQDRNNIGVDIKGDRLWKGSLNAIEAGLTNVAFLRTFILELDKFFDQDEVEEIWLTFPDPRPKDKEEKRRLTSKRFLDIYKVVLKPGGWVKLKTDSTFLYNYTLSELTKRKDINDLFYTEDLKGSNLLDEHHGITTRYEEIYLKMGKKIKYLKFRFP